MYTYAQVCKKSLRVRSVRAGSGCAISGFIGIEIIILLRTAMSIEPETYGDVLLYYLFFASAYLLIGALIVILLSSIVSFLSLLWIEFEDAVHKQN